MSLGVGAMSQATSANIACDVARGPGDIARGGGVSGRAMLRCRAMLPTRPSDVGESRATSLRQLPMSLRSLELGSDLATSLGPRATSLATSLVGAGGGGHKEIDVFFVSSPPPCGRPRLGGRLGDIVQAVSEVARPLRPRERCCDIARAPSDIAQRCWRAMLRCRAMWRGRPSDVLPSPRRPSDIARASSDIATSLPPGAAERRSDIAPLPSDIATSPTHG